MATTNPARESWADYLRRMTEQPGWTVARLAREADINRGTIFKWMRGETGVNVTSVVDIARALGDDPMNALRAAAGVDPGSQEDEEIHLVMTDPRLDGQSEVRDRIIALILDRRARDKAASLEETRRMIDVIGPPNVG